MNERLKSSGTVLVGLTGRMDSAVAAYLLKKQGYNVIGLSIVTCGSSLAKDESKLPNCYIHNLDAVKQLCHSLGISFYATDVKSQFESEIIDPLIANRLMARANTSCFRCTALRMLTLYEKMLQLKADFISTGHYAKVLKNIHSGQYFIHSNNDFESDQSIVLAAMPSEVLEKLILPLGELRKSDVIKIAKRFQIPAIQAEKKQSFCFTDKNTVNELVKSKVPKSLLKEGQAILKSSGNFYGDHHGMAFHYIGEKNVVFEGLSTTMKDCEIVGYQYQQGTIEVGPASYLTFEGTEVIRLHLSKGVDTSAPIHCFFKFKHSGQFYPCTLFFKNNNNALIEFKEKIYPIIPYETIILYDSNGRNSKVIGSGQVGRPGHFKLIDRVAEFRPKQIEDEQTGENKGNQSKNIFKF